ncbi:MAG: flippase [Bacteroidota bacterium]
MSINLRGILPKIITDKFNEKENILVVLANTFWLISDRVVRMVVALFVGAWIARYLSPDSYGKLNNALAFSSMFGAFSMLGFESILVRDLVKYKDKKYVLLGTAFYIRLVAGLISYLLAIASVFLIKNGAEDLLSRQLVYIISIGIVFQSFDVIDLYFQSQVKSKYTVIAKNTAFIFVSLVKIVLLVCQVSLYWFAWAWLAEMLFNAVGLIWIYRRNGYKFSKWRFEWPTAKSFLGEGWTMYIAYISSFAYMRIDQIMISKMIDDTSAGLFAAASKLYEIPLFIVIVVASSVFPSLVNIYSSDRELFYKRYEQITFITTVVGYALIIGTWLFGEFFIRLFFGEAFIGAYPILRIQMIAMFFLFNGCLRSSYLAIASKQKVIMYTSIISAFVNIGLNYVLIKTMGVTGAAISIAVTYFLSVFFLNIFFNQTKRIFSIQLKSIILLPLQHYWKNYNQRT